MKLQTIVDIKPSEWKIGYEDKILMLGSCFSDEIGRQMEERKMQVTCNPFGTLYNPLSIANAIHMTELPELVEHDGLWHSMAHHGSFSRATKEEAEKAVAESIETMQRALEEATVVIVTFGTAWVYELSAISHQPSVIVGNCHKMPEKWFSRRRLTVEEIVEAWQPILAQYADKKWLFTVSPIRHVRDGLHENQVSKATLLMAVDQMVNSTWPNGKWQYFPSYEIVMDELRDYRFYADDLVHPSSMAVEYIWERFCETFCTSQTINAMHLAHKEWKFAHHRPLHEA
ncbi:MAG: GSCFA domain-containing protein [Paludibacteraceae bacterium]|nr:GSCFA domain-containing protein [Paludibacteraceae bacterium]